MPYISTPPKPDLAFNEKYIYLCRTRGCGAQISEFPSGEKNPPPVHCKICADKTKRHEIEAEYDNRVQKT